MWEVKHSTGLKKVETLPELQAWVAERLPKEA